jgi:hypothetical protein
MPLRCGRAPRHRSTREETEPLDLANRGVVERENRLGNGADVASPVDMQEFWKKHGELPGFAAGTLIPSSRRRRLLVVDARFPPTSRLSGARVLNG